MTLAAPLIIIYQRMISVFMRKSLTACQHFDYLVEFALVEIAFAGKFEIFKILVCNFNPIIHR